MSTFIHGLRTYALTADIWPHAGENPDYPQSTHDFAPIWLNVPKIVYSRPLQHVEWNSELRREVVPDEIRALPGDNVVSGAELAATFLEHDLVDEIRLDVQPVAIDAGTPLFQKPIALALRKHQDVRQWSCSADLPQALTLR